MLRSSLLSAFLYYLICCTSINGSEETSVATVNGPTVPPYYLREEGKLAIHCPSTHPYPYMGNRRCCSSPWKLKEGSNSPDCDGYFLQIYSCGGRGCSSTYFYLGTIDECAILKSDGSWEETSPMGHFRYGPYTARLNVGTEIERVLLGGGYRTTGEEQPVNMEELDDDHVWSDAGITPPIKVYYNVCFQQVSEELLMLAGGKTGGGNHGQTNPYYYLYNLTSGTWSGAKQVDEDYHPNYQDEPGTGSTCVIDHLGRVVMQTGNQESESWMYLPKSDKWFKIGMGKPEGKCKTWMLTYTMGKVIAFGECTGLGQRVYELIPRGDLATRGGGYWSEMGTPSDFGLPDDAVTQYRFPVPIDEGEYPNLSC